MPKKIKGLYKQKLTYWYRWTPSPGQPQQRKSLQTRDLIEAVRKVEALQKIEVVSIPADCGWVYLCKCGHLYKIGITQNLDVRMRGHQVSNPFEIDLLKSWLFRPYALARTAEKLLHKYYRHLHHRGEWFNLTTEDVETLCSSSFLLQNHHSPGLKPELCLPKK